MKTENKSGPNIDPWGTDAWMEEVLDDWPDGTICQVAPNPGEQLAEYSFCHEFQAKVIMPEVVKCSFDVQGNRYHLLPVVHTGHPFMAEA